jgi:hypothetical protein
MRLCRSTLRKGSAFPTRAFLIIPEAAPQEFEAEPLTGLVEPCTVSQRLTAVCGGKAARLEGRLVDRNRDRGRTSLTGRKTFLSRNAQSRRVTTRSLSHPPVLIISNLDGNLPGSGRRR